MKRGLLLLIPAMLVVAGFATPAAAQGSSSTTPYGQTTPETEAVFATIPDVLFGTTGTRRPNYFLKTYFPKDMGHDPMAGVSINAVKDPIAEADWRAHVQEMFDLTTTVREGTFTSPRMPGAIGYFGEYLTATGLKQSWMIEQNGIRLAVLVTLFNGATSARKAAVREILDNVYQGEITVAEEARLPELGVTRKQNR